SKVPEDCRQRQRRTRRCSEPEPAGSLRDEFNVSGGWLRSLTFSLGVRTVMNTKRQKMSRMQFLWLRWLARHCPWYIRLVAGKHAGELCRQIKDAEEDFHEH